MDENMDGNGGLDDNCGWNMDEKGSRLYTHCSRLKVHMVACV